MFGRRSARDSGCCKRPHLFRAAGSQHPRTCLQRRAGRAHVVDQHDREAVDPRTSAQCEHRGDVLPSRLGGEAGLRARRPRSFQRAAHGQTENAGELVRLVEAATPLPFPVQGNRHDDIGPTQDCGPMLLQQRSERARQRTARVVLQRVHDCAKRAVVVAERGAGGDVRPACAARIATMARLDRPPRWQRIPTDPTERRPRQPDRTPARVAHSGPERLFQRTLARRARRCPDDAEQAVDGMPEDARNARRGTG